MITTKIICHYCGKENEKNDYEITRQRAKGRKRFYCNQKCFNDNHREKGDIFTPFRYHLQNAKRRPKSSKNNELQECSITLEDLKNLWDQQNGLCAVTGIELVPKIQYEQNPKIPYQASLDRIDNSKGYTKNNVRFVSLMFNLARNTFSDQEVIDFCKTVAKNF